MTTEIRTKQLRRLRNSDGGLDAIIVLYIDLPGDIATWACNVIQIANERNPFAPLEATITFAEAHRRLALLFPHGYGGAAE